MPDQLSVGFSRAGWGGAGAVRAADGAVRAADVRAIVVQHHRWRRAHPHDSQDQAPESATAESTAPPVPIFANAKTAHDAPHSPLDSTGDTPDDAPSGHVRPTHRWRAVHKLRRGAGPLLIIISVLAFLIGSYVLSLDAIAAVAFPPALLIANRTMGRLYSGPLQIIIPMLAFLVSGYVLNLNGIAAIALPAALVIANRTMGGRLYTQLGRLFARARTRFQNVESATARRAMLACGAIFIASMWLPWWRTEDITHWDSTNAWDGLDSQDAVFLLLALSVIAVAIAELTLAGTPSSEWLRVPTALAAAAAGLIAIMVLIRTVDIPWASDEAQLASDEFDLSNTPGVGLAIGILASLAATLAAYRLTQLRGGFRTVLSARLPERPRTEQASAAGAPRNGVAADLGDLAQLHDRGLLSPDEFAAAKARTLVSP